MASRKAPATSTPPSRSAPRPPNYAFSLHLHLNNSTAQRVLALSVREGLTPMQAVLRCLEQNLPQVQVKIVGQKPSDLVGATPSQTWELKNGADIIDLPTLEDKRDFVHGAPRKEAIANAVKLCVHAASNYRLFQDFSLPDLFHDGVWKGFPDWFRRALSEKFYKEILPYISGPTPIWACRVIRPRTMYRRLR